MADSNLWVEIVSKTFYGNTEKGKMQFGQRQGEWEDVKNIFAVLRMLIFASPKVVLSGIEIS